MKVSVNNNLYLSEYFNELPKKKVNKVIRNIIRGKFQPGIFVISISEDENNQLEITPAYIFLQPYYKDQHMEIVGLAESHNTAVEDVLVRITDDCYKLYGNCNFKLYFKEHLNGEVSS